jgi:hypothetical protein
MSGDLREFVDIFEKRLRERAMRANVEGKTELADALYEVRDCVLVARADALEAPELKLDAPRRRFRVPSLRSSST